MLPGDSRSNSVSAIEMTCPDAIVFSPISFASFKARVAHSIAPSPS